MHPRELPPCDLVMKGGVASGIVYPGAVLELSERYRFEKLGGTSAGAIAAAMAAAAEFGRQRAGRRELRAVVEIAEEFKRPGFVLSLFQPAPAGRPLFELGLSMASAKRSRWRQTRVLGKAAIRHGPIHVLLATVGAAGILALLAAAIQHLGPVPAIVLVGLGSIGLMLLAGSAILAPLVSMVRSVWRSLPAQGFGICPGVRQVAGGPAAMTEWMHAKIQQCAELPLDRPLTFTMLEQEGISLQMVATDLGLARPVTIPFDEEQYLFAPSELRGLFPAEVVEHVLTAAGVPAGHGDASRAWVLPAKELPVVIGARLSSSVPLLLSSLKLYRADPDAPGPIESFISDGGITSNFPIHFFDDWLPSHPTFGLDLVPFVEGEDPVDAAQVYLPSEHDAPRLPHSSTVRSLSSFLRQIEDATRNWRDELQAELPGFRDRVCQIRMHPGEGGLHLNADPDTVIRLLERGRAAGREILHTFDWDRHRFVRYITLMTLLQENFSLLGERFDTYRGWLATAAPQLAAYGAERDLDWLQTAEQATLKLIEHAPGLPGMGPHQSSQPEPALRIGPRV